MYRIEIKPGEEAVFRTIEELATGIRNGFVTPRARIYHAASQKWLPIEFHPHYKKALEGNFTPTPAAPQPSLATMPAPTFAFPAAAPAPSSAPASPPAFTSAPAPVTTAPAPVRPPSSVPTKAPPSAAIAAESPVLAMRAAIGHGHDDLAVAEAEGPVERYSPVAVLEAPRLAPALAMSRPAPALAPAPEVVLPNITYPEVAPMQQEHRAPARRSRRAAGRPLLLIGSAAALVLGGQRYLASRGDTVEAAPVSEIPPPAVTPASVGVSASQPRAAVTPKAPPRQPTAPVLPPPTQRMQPGPAFAASVPASGAVMPPAQAAAPHIVPTSPALLPGQTAPADNAIAPAPSAIDLEVPAVVPDSIAPAVVDGRDSLAIKRILKAVTGRKADPTAP
jgi:hypothetical protein